MKPELDQLIEGYAELYACYEEREAELRALNRAINKAAHTPIFLFDLPLLADVVNTIKKLKREFPKSKAFLKDPFTAIWKMSIDFDLALPGHSRLKAARNREKTLDFDLGYMQSEQSILESGAYDEPLKQVEIATKLEAICQEISEIEAEYTAHRVVLSALEKEFPLAAMALDGKTELSAFDQHFDLILSGYSELKTAYATQVVLLEQYNDARKAVINHPEFKFNLHRLGELDQDIERLETQYPQAVEYHQKLLTEQRMQVLDLRTDPEPPSYFPFDADYLFSNDGVTP